MSYMITILLAPTYFGIIMDDPISIDKVSESWQRIHQTIQTLKGVISWHWCSVDNILKNIGTHGVLNHLASPAEL